MSSEKQLVLVLYKQLFRECQKFSLYNYREYFLRRVRDEFRRNGDVQDSFKITELVKQGQENLGMIRRQVTIGNLYTPGQRALLDNRVYSTTN